MNENAKAAIARLTNSFFLVLFGFSLGAALEHYRPDLLAWLFR